MPSNPTSPSSPASGGAPNGAAPGSPGGKSGDGPSKWSASDLPPALNRAIELALDTRAKIPVVLRIGDCGAYTDWALLLSGRSERNVRAITDSILDGLAKEGVRPLGTDGTEEGQWALLDLDDFIVHVFYHPVRTHYDLESMWSDAPRVELDVDAEAFDEHDLLNLEAPEPMPGFRAGRVPGADDAAGDEPSADGQDWDLSEFGGFEDEFSELGLEPGADPSDDAKQAPDSKPSATAGDSEQGDSKPEASDEDSLFDD